MAPLVARKLLPLMVRVNAGLPAGRVVGEIEVTDGGGFGGGLITKAKTLESPLVPDPEWGLSVLTKAVPCFATKEAATCAVTPVMLPAESVAMVVGMVVLFHCTTVFAVTEVKLPVTVKVKAALPAGTVAGDKEVILAPVGT